MKNVQKIAEKIEALRAELSEARAAEKRQAAEVAERDLQRAIRASGLLPLLSAGTLTREQLEREFRALAERAGRLDSGPVIAEREQP